MFWNFWQDTLQATPRNFGRSNPFESKQSHSQKSQKDVYKEELQKQVYRSFNVSIFLPILSLIFYTIYYLHSSF